MARSVITNDQWVRAREYFEHGLSLKEISDKTGISRGAISKKSSSEEWDKESPKKLLLSHAVEVSEAKETLKKHPVSYDVHEELHDEKLRHKKLIYGNAEKLANKLFKMTDQIDTPNDLKTLADANDRLAITMKIADRHAPKIDVTQMQQLAQPSEVKIELVEDKAVND